MTFPIPLFDRYVVNSANEMSSRILEWFRGFPVPTEGVDARGEEYRCEVQRSKWMGGLQNKDI